MTDLLILFFGGSLHPGIALALDLVLRIALFVVGLIATASATQTLQWTAAQYYNDALSGHDGYYAYEGANIGRVWVPPKNATTCSGFGSCTEQDAFTDWTHHRAIVELVACAITWVAVYVSLLLACTIFELTGRLYQYLPLRSFCSRLYHHA